MYWECGCSLERRHKLRMLCISRIKQHLDAVYVSESFGTAFSPGNVPSPKIPDLKKENKAIFKQAKTKRWWYYWSIVWLEMYERITVGKTFSLLYAMPYVKQKRLSLAEVKLVWLNSPYFVYFTTFLLLYNPSLSLSLTSRMQHFL